MSNNAISESDYTDVFQPEVRKIFEKILSEIANVLNQIHETQFSTRFWEILLEPYIHSVISRKELMSSHLLYQTPLFDAINGYSFPTRKEIYLKKIISFAKALMWSNNFNENNTILKKNNSVAFGFHYPQGIKRDVEDYLKPYLPLFLKSKEKFKRDRANEIASSYDDIYIRNIIHQLPQIYVEYFLDIYDKIPIYSSDKKSFHISILANYYDRMLIAKYICNGSKLYWYQHGGYYGEISNHISYLHERKLADYFVTWGWQLNNRDIEGKAYRLEGFKVKYDKYITNVTKSFDYLLCYPTIQFNNREQFSNFTHLLLRETLKKGSTILARPRPTNRLLNFRSQLNFISDDRVKIDSGRASMAKVIAQSKLVIQFTYPSTNFLECVYVNHPTIAILNNDNPTDIVKPYYDFFLSEGVFHDSFESLIKHLKITDIDKWWLNVISKPMYKSFKNTFCRAV